jgi:hypothetical protein
MNDYLSASDIRNLTGLSKASVARLASKNEIPGAFRHDGVHFRYENSRALAAWIELQNAKRKIPAIKKTHRLNADDKSVGLVTIEGVHMQFNMWLRKVTEDDAFPTGWDEERLKKVRELLKPIVAVDAEIATLCANKAGL